MTTILAKIKEYGALILLVFLLGITVYQYWFVVKPLRSDNATLNTSLNAANNEITSCKNSLDSQNLAIKQAQDKTTLIQQTLNDTATQLKAQQDANQKLITKLQNQPAPKTDAEISQYLQDNLELYKTW